MMNPPFLTFKSYASYVQALRILIPYCTEFSQSIPHEIVTLARVGPALLHFPLYNLPTTILLESNGFYFLLCIEDRSVQPYLLIPLFLSPARRRIKKTGFAYNSSLFEICLMETYDVRLKLQLVYNASVPTLCLWPDFNAQEPKPYTMAGIWQQVDQQGRPFFLPPSSRGKVAER